MGQYRVAEFEAPDQEVSRLGQQARLVATREVEALGAVGFPGRGVAVEIGCGPGFFAESLRRGLPGLQLYGFDIDPYVLREARARLPVVRGDASAGCLPFGPASLDGAYARLFLRHVTDPARVLDAMGTLVKPGGCVAAIDGSDASLLLDPLPADFTAIAAARGEWFARRGCSPDIGHRLPGLFVQAGLEGVEVRAVNLDSATVGREAFAQIVLVPFLQAAAPILADRERHAAAAQAVERWTRARGSYGTITLFVVGARRGSHAIEGGDPEKGSGPKT